MKGNIIRSKLSVFKKFRCVVNSTVKAVMSLAIDEVIM